MNNINASSSGGGGGKASASSSAEQAAAHKQRTLKAYVLNKYEQYKVSLSFFVFSILDCSSMIN
jgi:hypothetical protein